MTRTRAYHWLKGGSAFVTATGLAVALAAWPQTGAPIALLADLAFWPPDGAQSLAAGETRLLAAIGGGVMAGWGVTMWRIVDRLYLENPALARSFIMPGLLLWFAVDSLGSLISGGALNVVGNVGFLALFMVPILLADRAAPIGSGASGHEIAR